MAIGNKNNEMTKKQFMMLGKTKKDEQKETVSRKGGKIGGDITGTGEK
eukprot:CAMPEP_0197828364 /NCGR_PEP_ID=MMETSP1437-20131217/4943_1 /TAXON_ID=49252 ORGANISM="Eucampia antarctica, Strain CCMP1452" /NCGR_SAMPLE_ID=MMETSP1437 /ASSEMBLY_ACC=CAM_ASM_001096 /LENGTH=47 /DNA_ID= /DNA_START= /DNA_END= /DNA_ORIENTATION=